MSAGKFRLVEEYDVDLVLCILACSRANGIDFIVASEPFWSHFCYENSSVFALKAFMDSRLASVIHAAAPLHYGEE